MTIVVHLTYILYSGNPIDLYQIHFPNAWANEEYWEGLADAYDLGLVKAVGVSNYGVDALKACHSKLAERGIKLASNQIQNPISKKDATIKILP